MREYLVNFKSLARGVSAINAQPSASHLIAGIIVCLLFALPCVWREIDLGKYTYTARISIPVQASWTQFGPIKAPITKISWLERNNDMRLGPIFHNVYVK